MARIDRRLKVWGWIAQRQAATTVQGEEAVIALHSRAFPDNALMNFIFGSVRPGVEVSDRTIPGPGGDLPVRIYRPGGAAAGPRPLVLNFHGGGFVFGSLRMSDLLRSKGAAPVGAVVVAGDYPVGPLLPRDRGGPALSHQTLLYPATALTRVAPPPSTGEKPLFLSVAEMQAYRRYYLGDSDPGDFRASPLLAPDHSGLPPALIQVGEHDPLRGDGVRYAEVLRAVGVPGRLTEYVGMPHRYPKFPGLCRLAAQALAEITAEQQAALAPVRTPAA